MLNVLRDWLQRRQELHHLGRLDERLLADMGLERGLLAPQLRGEVPRVLARTEQESRRRKDRQRLEQEASHWPRDAAVLMQPWPALKRSG